MGKIENIGRKGKEVVEWMARGEASGTNGKLSFHGGTVHKLKIWLNDGQILITMSATQHERCCTNQKSKNTP